MFYTKRISRLNCDVYEIEGFIFMCILRLSFAEINNIDEQQNYRCYNSS